MKGQNKLGGNKRQLYWLALCGVLAISGTVYAGIRPREEKTPEDKLIDLNEQPGVGEYDDPYAFDNQEDLHADTGNDEKERTDVENPERQDALVSAGDSGKKTDKEPDGKPDMTADGKTNEKPEDTTDAKQHATQKDNQEETIGQDDKTDVAVSTDGDSKENQPKEETVRPVDTPKAEELKFSEEEGLQWPLQGNVIKDYSADKMVFFDTLQQFRTNPAVFIAGEPGSEIVAAADGIVKKLDRDDKLGNTLVLDIGDGYLLIYGQIKDINVKEGDYVAAGANIAKLARATKYYRIEGNHLYFQVTKDETTINPMMLIR